MSLVRSFQAAALLVSAGSAASPNGLLDRPYTLRNGDPAVLEARHAAMIHSGGPLGFAFPSPCGPVRMPGCPDSAGHRLQWDRDGDALGATLTGALEQRTFENPVTALEAGAVVSGSKSGLSFLVDARTFTEVGGIRRGGSFDREDVDFQDDSSTGSITYLSYSRYRGNLNWDTQIGRFTAFRDAAHWGPGLHENLFLNQESVPFHGFSYQFSLGPVSVTSLYGDLAIGGTQGGSSENLDSRSLYAHRYEAALGRNLLLGATDQIILFDQSKPFLFIPAFPLFISKGTLYEESNNGSLGVDATWRWPGVLLLYSEFLLDDIESPSSIFLKEYSQNKWGWMAGVHAERAVGGAMAGVVLEYSRLEPWVYSHFTSNTAQAANLGYPLGNPAGPNSQTGILKGYGRHPRWGYLGLQSTLAWKGTDPGSTFSDPAPKHGQTPKSFLGGGGSPEFSVEAQWAYAWRFMDIRINGRTGGESSAWARLAFRY